MRSVSITRFTLSIFAAVIVSFALLFVVLARNSHAEYDCETYSSGNYSAGDSGTGDACPTADTSTGSGTSSGSTSTATTSGASSTTKSTSTTTTSGDTTTTTTTPVDGAKSVTLNDYAAYENGSGQTLTVKVGDKAYFTVGSEAHTVTIKEVTADYIIFTIASTPTDVKVPYGQSVNYDVDKDGKNDITLAYNSLSDDKSTATVAFSAIATTDEAAAKPVSVQSTTPSENTVKSNYWWILIPAVIIVAIGAFFIIRKNRASKKGNFTPTDFNK